MGRRAKLDEVGIESQIFESEPGRASTIARIEGTDRDRPPLLIHGHLDVVPADAAEWSVDPFAGEISDGYVWGRGAIDMKDMDAMTLAVRPEVGAHVIASRRATSCSPSWPTRRPAARAGAHWLVDNHPDLFADCTEAISEVGGYSVSIGNDLRLYPIQTAEKGIDWLRLRATGTTGPRLDGARRQRGHAARRRGIPNRRARVPGAS